MKRAILFSLPLTALALASVPAAARSSALPNQIELGRNAAGNPCQATRNWKDEAVPDPFATSYSFTCRGTTANRFLGMVRNVRISQAPAIDATLECGADAAVTLPGLGAARARKCFDRVLGQETIETRVTRGGRLFSVSAIMLAQGPAEEALRILAGVAPAAQDRGRTTTAAFDPAMLAPAPSGGGGTAAAVADADAALRQGLR
ncbi:MAG TPA: hypothetical protein PKE25_13455, partial [Novosphingobium sp.]|nr:hypothetical protein [Novosphingobium sp.]